MPKKLTFLLVDDDSDDADLFAEVLNEVGSAIDLLTANNGFEALEKLEKGTTIPDVIFLDLNMPRMGGKECLTSLKSNERLRRIPVIIYTTSTQSKDIEETMMIGAVCFITKPSSMKDLKKILSSIAASLPMNLEKNLRQLSNSSNIFIVC